MARADLTGGLETRLAVTLDPAKLTSSGRRPSQQVVAVLGANNLTLPSGQLPADGSQHAGLDDRPAHLGRGGRDTSSSATPGTPPNTTPVTIGDLGTVELDSIATTGYGRTNGQPALTLTVSKTSNANTVEVADAVQAKLAEIAARHTDVMTVSTVQDLSVFIKESRDGLLREGGLGAIFAILTIFLFLLSLRATIVAAISIPLSILTALVIMQLTGVTHQHHDPGRPGGGRRPGGRRRDRRAREHLPPPRARRGPPDGGHQRAEARSPGRSRPAR